MNTILIFYLYFNVAIVSIYTNCEEVNFEKKLFDIGSPYKHCNF